MLDALSGTYEEGGKGVLAELVLTCYVGQGGIIKVLQKEV